MFNNVKGNWSSEKRFILCSCDERYFKVYFKRFYDTFTELWQLPIHIHIIDPSEQSLKWLESKQISHTHCNTNDYNWKVAIDKFRIATERTNDDTIIKKWIYESYTQCQRFVLLGYNMRSDQSIIVADVDAYAQRVPNRRSRKELFRQTAFSRHGGRIMATFCHLHPNDLSKIRNVAEDIVHTANNDHFQIGLDQKALAKVFNQEVWTKLDKNWIRHFDVKDETDRHHHSLCYIYHEKGLRGKDFDVKWTSW